LSYLRKSKSDIFIKSEGNEDEINKISDTEENDDSVFNANFSKEELLFAVESLPENYKLIFNLFCIENYSHKEISEMLSITEESSRTRLNRARKILQEYLLALHKKRLSV
jgi:RNA polymerase sigma-70 factor (ECF subfamily)